MPSQDEIMQQILELVSKGAGMALTPELESALRERYYDWIVKKKNGVPTSPQEIWEEQAGEKIKKRVEKIGERLAEKKKTKPNLDKKDVVEVALAVEADSDCPHCP
jgi:hypothetical protein